MKAGAGQESGTSFGLLPIPEADQHDLRAYVTTNEGRNGGAGGTFTFAVVKSNSAAYWDEVTEHARVVFLECGSVPPGLVSLHELL